MTSDQTDIDPGPAAGTVRGTDPVARALTFLTGRAVSLQAASMLRIGYGLIYLVFLLREFPQRDEIWGPGSPWTPVLARELFGQTGWFSILILSDSTWYFEVCYGFALITAALFMLGWHTRAISLLFALVVVSFHGRSIYMADGGDNLIVLMAVYLVLTDCGRCRSLDARRRRRVSSHAARRLDAPSPSPSSVRQQADLARRMLSTLLHNCGMFVIAAQVCILYGAAGLYKVQGGLWRDGTALHYVLNLDLFQPWPALSAQVDSHQLLAAVAGYLTVLVQVAFPFTVFSRLKYVVLCVLLAMHVGIAVLLGLPMFSGSMIVADTVFLSDGLITRVMRRFRLDRYVVSKPAPHPLPVAAESD
jgi:hypothetical protein